MTIRTTQHRRATIGDASDSASEDATVDDKLITIAEVAAILRTPVATLRY